MVGLAAGRFDRRITFSRYSLARDEFNQANETWTDDAAPVWASWRRATANERLASGQIGAQVTDIFEIRWSSDVARLDPKDRVKFNGLDYDIVEVTEIGRREGLLVRATARADRG